MNRRRPRYPIYVPSKGRSFRPLTIKRLMEMDLDFRVVVEPSEAKEYRAVVPDGKLLVLPFENLGQGSIPARNWIWDHALSAGARRHWVIDDNIVRFYRLNFNRRIPCNSPAIFAACEDFTDRYENIALSGMQYLKFAIDRAQLPPYVLNTRVYSCTLINSGLPYRWRGKFNEDTDLSLVCLKDGWCTILFNAFLADKMTSMKLKGGNTDALYSSGDHRRAFAESLKEQHPDVVEVVWKFNRWHHQVDYSRFRKNRFELRPGVTPTGCPDEYGMTLRPRDASVAEGETQFELFGGDVEQLELPFWSVFKSWTE